MILGGGNIGKLATENSRANMREKINNYPMRRLYFQALVKNSVKKKTTKHPTLEIQLNFQREINKKMSKREIEKGAAELKSKKQKVNWRSKNRNCYCING